MAFEERETPHSRSHLEEREGRKVLVIRWNMGKTSAGRLFGKYGEGGRPDFFRLLFGAIAGSLKEQFGPQGEEMFSQLRSSDTFRKSSNELFDQMKDWFFREVAPRYGLERGDIFMVITELELDVQTWEVRWRREHTEFYYWVRSDRCMQTAPPKGCEDLARENQALKEEVERLRRELATIKERLSSLLK